MKDEILGRKIVVWGAGKLCESYLERRHDIIPTFVLDNNIEKDGKYLQGLKIVNPQRITDWNQFFIIIITKYEEEIKVQLEKKGLYYGIDFISIRDFYMNFVNIELLQESYIEYCFRNNMVLSELECEVRTQEEYNKLKEKYSVCENYESLLNGIYKKNFGERGVYKGYCGCCQRNQYFETMAVPEEELYFWRELFKCPICNCNSRMRYIVERVRHKYSNKKMYIYEKITSTYRELKAIVPNIIGSEYLSEELKSGEVQNGILHEDAMALSFKDNSFDIIISNDVFEHVADYKKAFTEALRCLKKDGVLLFSIPIFKERYKNITRTKIDAKGNIEYVMEPKYHGNPLSKKGSLVFTEFGWEILDVLKECGYRDAYAIAYFSVEKGYFGDIPVVFEAIK